MSYNSSGVTHNLNEHCASINGSRWSKLVTSRENIHGCCKEKSCCEVLCEGVREARREEGCRQEACCEEGSCEEEVILIRT